MTPELLAVIGFITSLLLGMNAYFVKGLFDSVNQVKIQTALLVERAVNGDARLKTVEDEVMRLRERNHALATELGNRIQLLEFKIHESA